MVWCGVVLRCVTSHWCVYNKVCACLGASSAPVDRFHDFVLLRCRFSDCGVSLLCLLKPISSLFAGHTPPKTRRAARNVMHNLTKRQAAIAWVSGTDPTGGMEYVTDKALAEDDPSKEKDLAMALLQERANLKDFICQVWMRSRSFLFYNCVVAVSALKRPPLSWNYARALSAFVDRVRGETVGISDQWLVLSRKGCFSSDEASVQVARMQKRVSTCTLSKVKRNLLTGMPRGGMPRDAFESRVPDHGWDSDP